MPYMGIQELKDANIKSGSATGDGSTTTFAIGWTPPSEQALFVTINGILQSAAALNLSGANCVFTAAPASGDAIEFKGIQSGGTVTTLGDGVVNAAQLGASSVVTASIVDSNVTTAKILDSNVTLAKMADDSVGIAELSATGTAQAGTYLQGDNTWGAIATAGFNSMQFLTSGNWTRPTGVTKVVVTLVGGGGGGGAGNPPTWWGGSGGGAGVMKCVLDVSSISTSTLSIGAAGTTSGGTGGSTTWTDGTNTLTATGGAGGAGGGGGWHGAGGAGGAPVVNAGTPLAQLLLTGGHGTTGSAGGSQPGVPLLGYGWAAYDYGNPVNHTQTGYGVAGYGKQTGSTAGVAGIVIVEEYK